MQGKFHTANVLAGCLLVLSGSLQAQLDLQPIAEGQWSREHAAHLASRAGFGATPGELDELQAKSPQQAVAWFMRSGADDASDQFEPSGIFEPGLDPFPPSRPATTQLARRQGHALGVKVRPSGNRPMQGVVNKFFYWLRASRLETDRVAYWWAERMLRHEYPLQERLALFWHGHFATNEDKVRDYRKMFRQVLTLRQLGMGDFETLLIAVAQDPAMLTFLDAGVNTKDSPNENFAREIMELFTMGVGHYSERDVQEAARAFTGWNVQQMQFVVNDDHHDRGTKRFLGSSGNFDGIDVIRMILAQPASANFIAAKLYRHFVNEDLAPGDEAQLGELLRTHDLHVGDYLRALFLSRDFYAAHNRGSRIKGPVELMVSTYRQLGLDRVPGVPDFNVTAQALGQRLLHPPTVAGWSEGRSWITPSLLFERGNFVLDVLFPDIGFVPPDRFPAYTREIVNVQNRLRQGMSVSEATRPTGVQGGEMAASNMLADRDEAFNTRLGSMRGWQMALERVTPIPRHTARVDLAGGLTAAGITTAQQAIEYWHSQYFSVALEPAVIAQLVEYLVGELGTADLVDAASYAEEALRKTLHQMLSLPEYQLG